MSLTNQIAGGDRGILAIFSERAREAEPDHSVNDLILRCSSSKAALAQLYTMFKDSVFAIAFSIIGDYHLAEDCVAETFVRLTQLRRFSPEGGDGRGVIIATARNVALELRRRYRRDIGDICVQPYEGADQKTMESIYINNLLSCLNDKQRQVVVLKCCADMTFSQIAKIMKSPESTVKSRYRKAMVILQEKAGVEK